MTMDAALIKKAFHIYLTELTGQTAQDAPEAEADLVWLSVKKIVEEHGGKIWATSQKGEGTTIFFTLKKYIKEENENEQNIDN